MSIYIVACRGRVDEEQLTMANKSLGKRSAMCISTLSPTSDSLGTAGIEIVCSHESSQLLKALSGERRRRLDVNELETPPEHVVLIISAKLRPAKLSPQPSFAMDVFKGDSSQKPFTLKELGLKMGESFRGSKTITLIFNSMGALQSDRAAIVIKDFIDGVASASQNGGHVDPLENASQSTVVRGFVALDVEYCTGNSLELFLAQHGSGQFAEKKPEGWEIGASQPSSIWVKEVDPEALADEPETTGTDSPPRQPQQSSAPSAAMPPSSTTALARGPETTAAVAQPVTVAARVTSALPSADDFRSIWNQQPTMTGSGAADSAGVIGAKKPLTTSDYYCSKCHKSYSDPITHEMTCTPRVTVHAVAENPLPKTQAFQECNELLDAGIIIVTEEVIPGSQVVRKPNPNMKELLPSERWCDLCGMQVNGEKNWLQHVAGEKHARLTEKSMTPMMQRAYNCLSCGTKVYGESNLLQHIGGGKHLKAAEGRVHTCQVCEVVCHSDRKYVEHLQSESHKIRSCPMY